MSFNKFFFLPISMIDYPNKISSVIFNSLCNFKCPYCYNVDLGKECNLDVDEIIKKVLEKKKVIDGVVFIGGEPLINFEDLLFMMKEIKKMGLNVKLDTNGSFPFHLDYLIDKQLVDYVAVDIKTSFKKYDFLVDDSDAEFTLKETARILRKNRIDYEWRTTVISCLFEKEDVLEIFEFLKAGEKYFLQSFSDNGRLLDREKLFSRCPEPYLPKKEIEKYVWLFKEKGIKIDLRRYK